MLNRPSHESFKSRINGEGIQVTNEKEIYDEINAFYKNLYENYEKPSDEEFANDPLFLMKSTLLIMVLPGSQSTSLERPW